MTEPAALEAADLCVRRGTRAVLDGVHVRLEHGSLLAILGPNGAGKTTLLRSLVGLIPLARGRVDLEGRPLNARTRKEIARAVSYLPQLPEVPAELLVEQAVWMGRYPHLRRMRVPGAGDHAAVEDAMQQAGVSGLRHRALAEISGGERQRVMLARSLATHAPIWLLDEPTSSLDVAHALEIFARLRAQAAAGRAIAVAVHDLNLALRFADRFLLLRGGREIASGDASHTLRPDLLQSVFEASFSVVEREDGLHLLAGSGVPNDLRARPRTASRPPRTS